MIGLQNAFDRVRQLGDPRLLDHTGGAFERVRQAQQAAHDLGRGGVLDRKSTRLNSSHLGISYAVFCLNDTATTEIYTLSLHDALPICCLTTRAAPLSVCARRSRRPMTSGAGVSFSSCRIPWASPSRSSRASTRKYLYGSFAIRLPVRLGLNQPHQVP